MPAVLSAVVADALVASERLVSDDALVSDSVRLVCDTEALLDVRTRVMATLVRRLRAAHDLDAIALETGRSTKSWLIEDQLLSPREAGDLMLLIRFLDQFSATDAAFAATVISFEHAVRIVRGLLNLPPAMRETVEPHLLECAHDNAPSELKGFIRELVERLGLMDNKEAAEQQRLAERGLSLATTLDGTRSISGGLTPDGGAVIAEALRTFDSGDGEDDDRTSTQRDHDSLVGICREFLERHGALPSFSGTPVGVIVTIPLEVLEGRLADQDATLLPSGARIGPDTARRLACDAQFIPIVLGGCSEILDVGRASRDFTEAQRRAQYFAQQGRCAFPKCRRRVTECHHIIWWSANGKTCLVNAAWLCAFHHWIVHEGRWKLRKHADGSFTFTSPRDIEYTRHIRAG